MFAAVLALATSAAFAADKTDEGVALTIYNQNFAVVRETRKMEIKQKSDTLRFTDVAAQIDGTSVHFKSLTDTAATVLEQNFEYDLVSADKLLQKYIDKSLTVLTKDGSRYYGNLLSFDPGQLVLRQYGEKGDVVMIQRGDNVKDIQFSALPDGLITKPTLVWLVSTKKTGSHLVEVAYQTTGLGWQADYNAVLDAKDSHLDLNAWVTINNRSGATYKDARVKLMAGDVRRIQPPRSALYKARAMNALMADADGGGAGFEEKAFFEYHLYTLQRTATVGQNQTKQIELLKTADVPVKKVFLYDGLPSHIRYYGGTQMDGGYGNEPCNKKVNVIVEIKNSKDNHMGMPLPKGKVRLFKRDDADGSLEFIGEDQIDHTAKDETMKLKVGDAFDVVGDRKRTDFRVDRAKHEMTETVEISVRNRKAEPIEVLVKESLYRGANWEILNPSHPFKKFDAQTIHIPVKLDKESEQTVTYAVRYTW